MENASKALIIAGAILISILLISLGILIYNQATNITNGQQMDEVERTSFNSKFQQYEGANVTGAQVKAMINQVVSSNAGEEDENKKVKVNAAGSLSDTDCKVDDTTAVSSGISSSGRYTVKITNYGENGLVNEIEVSK